MGRLSKSEKEEGGEGEGRGGGFPRGLGHKKYYTTLQLLDKGFGIYIYIFFGITFCLNACATPIARINRKCMGLLHARC